MLSGEQIELVLRVIDEGSFSGAARVSGRRPSAISMAIAAIEADLGFALFDRSRREPVPTPELSALIPEARLIVERTQALRRHAQELAEGAEARLKLAVTADLSQRRVMDALAGLGESFPNLDIDLIVAPQEVVVDALHSGHVNFCVAFGRVNPDPREIGHMLWRDSFIAVAARDHPLATAQRLTLEELKHHRQIIVASDRTDDARALPALGGRVWRVGTVAQAAGLLERGAGWANLVKAEADRGVATGKLRRLEFSNVENGLTYPVHFRMRRGHSLFSAGQHLLNLLRAPAAR